MTEIKALIIEDDEIYAQWISTWLSPFVTEAVIAMSMREAWEEIRKAPTMLPLIITIDLNMPDSSRIQTEEALQDFRAAIPDGLLIVLTGYDKMVDRTDLLRKGADAVIGKSDAATDTSFLSQLRDVLKSLTKQPERYKKNIPVVEALAEKVVEHLKQSQTSA